MLTDRQRIELALPARMVRRCAFCAFAMRDPETGTADEGDVSPEGRVVLQDLATAIEEAFAGTHGVHREKLIRRLHRTSVEVLNPYEKRPLVVVSMAVLYWLRDELEAGTLELIEGSAADRAISAYIEALQDHEDLLSRTERSALRNSRVIGGRLRALGYYQRRTAA